MPTPRHAFPLPILALLLATSLACGKSNNAADKGESEEPSPAAKPATPKPAKLSPARAMANRVVKALATNDYSILDSMLTEMGRTEMGELNERMFHTLRENFEQAGIDLTKVSIERVESSGSDIETVDVFLSHEGRGFHFHFNVMTLSGGYDYMGHAEWFKWDDEDDSDD